MQAYWDMEWVSALREAREGSPARRPGESIGQTRDRLRAEREAAKRRLGVA